MLPSRRGEWAAAMARLLRPGGLLVCLAFPLGAYPLGTQPDPAKGPPFQLTTALYEELLAPAFEPVSAEAVPAAESDERRAGLEAVLLWKRKAAL